MNLKTCRACGREAEHYASIATKCKDCWKSYVRANRKKNVEHYRAFDRDRGQTAGRKGAYAAKQRRMRAENPQMSRAHAAVRSAVRDGALIRPAQCERCHSIADIEAHHDDHRAELDVMWLCPACHAQRHVELGRLGAFYGNDIPLGF